MTHHSHLSYRTAYRLHSHLSYRMTKKEYEERYERNDKNLLRTIRHVEYLSVIFAASIHNGRFILLYDVNVINRLNTVYLRHKRIFKELQNFYYRLSHVVIVVKVYPWSHLVVFARILSGYMYSNEIESRPACCFTWLSLYNVRTRGQDDGEIERMNCVTSIEAGNAYSTNVRILFVRGSNNRARAISTRSLTKQRRLAPQSTQEDEGKMTRKEGERKDNYVHLSRIICAVRRRRRFARLNGARRRSLSIPA